MIINRAFSLLFMLLLYAVADTALTKIDIAYRVNEREEAVTAFLDDSSALWVSVPEICTKSGFSYVWSPERRRILVSYYGKDVYLSEDNPYLVVDSRLVDLLSSPRVIRGELVLKEYAAAILISVLVGSVVEYDSSTNRFIAVSEKELVTAPVRDTMNAIRRTLIDERKNGTMLTIFLPDSLVFDYTYFKPQLNINIVKARISVSEIKMDSARGLIKELAAVQFAENAQVSIILSDRALMPEVRFRSNPYRIEVVIRGEAVAVTSAPTPTISDSSVSVENPKPLQVVKRRIGTIYIDPGHGGKDPGAVNSRMKLYEKDAVLSVGKKIVEKLGTIDSELKVKLTRDSDTFVPLGERAKIANKGGGDLFVSIHLNSVKGSPAKQASVTGYCVYFLDVALNDAARAAAALENAALEFEDSDQSDMGSSSLDFILKSAELNLYRNESEDLAIMIEKAMAGRINEYSRHHNGVDQAAFYVLKGPEMPSVLIEVGFICNPKEAALLFDSSFQTRVAEAVSTGIMNFKKKYENRTTE